MTDSLLEQLERDPVAARSLFRQLHPADRVALLAAMRAELMARRERTCKHCGVVFAARFKGQRCCSTTCGIEHRRGKRVTHCKNGHEYSPENSRVDPSGYRDCRACDSMRGRRARREQSARRTKAPRTHCKNQHEYTVENTFIVTKPDGSTVRGCRECQKFWQLSRRTHCKRGHEYTPENTRVGAAGQRCCKACYDEPLACKRGHEYTPENTYISPSEGRRYCKVCRAIDARTAKLSARARREATPQPRSLASDRT